MASHDTFGEPQLHLTISIGVKLLSIPSSALTRVNKLKYTLHKFNTLKSILGVTEGRPVLDHSREEQSMADDNKVENSCRDSPLRHHRAGEEVDVLHCQ